MERGYDFVGEANLVGVKATALRQLLSFGCIYMRRFAPPLLPLIRRSCVRHRSSSSGTVFISSRSFRRVSQTPSLTYLAPSCLSRQNVHAFPGISTKSTRLDACLKKYFAFLWCFLCDHDEHLHVDRWWSSKGATTEFV